jgi:DNA-binding XRE family transcriptional regulator
MNDKERIIRIMNEENMNASQFSESIGIQRAAISHILAGRNNPSLDVIKKILKRFPTISPDWLLSGEGPTRRLPQDPGSSNHTDTVTTTRTTVGLNAGIDSISGPNLAQGSNTGIKYSSAAGPAAEKYDLFSSPPPSTLNLKTNTAPVQKNTPYPPPDIRTEIHFTDDKLQGEDVNNTANEMKGIVKETIIYKERPNKTIEKLLIFYSDNTFETFIPEKRDE